MPERFLGRSLGKFRVDGLIGTGGFAWVYKAYDPELEVSVALKVLKPQFAGDEQFEQRFRREAAIAARLRHPNIIKIFAVGKDSEAVYFAMDFLPQGLPDRLEVLNRLPDSVLIRIGIDVGSALGFAHREGVVHRDIKVDNILFDEHGNAIVADFGIARAVSNYVQETGTNMVVGTPQYFSPEQARGLPLDGRSDIYSLGVTLYRAATGVLPFVGDDWYDIARQHVEERAVRARKHNPQLGRDLEAVIMRCLEKNPDARYQTGEALCQALAALSFERADTIAMRGTPAPAGPNATPPAQTARPSRWLGIPGVAAIARIPRLITALPLRTRRFLAVGTAAAGLAATVIGVDATMHAASNPEIVVPAPPLAPSDGQLPTLAPATVSAAPPAQPAALARPAIAPRVHEVKSGTAPASSAPAKRSTAAHGFGTVRLDTKPAGAVYTLQGVDNGHVTKGRTPLTGPLTLPAGTYTLLISARYCASYRDTVRIAPNKAAAPLHIRLVCGG